MAQYEAQALQTLKDFAPDAFVKGFAADFIVALVVICEVSEVFIWRIDAKDLLIAVNRYIA